MAIMGHQTSKEVAPLDQSRQSEDAGRKCLAEDDGGTELKQKCPTFSRGDTRRDKTKGQAHDLKGYFFEGGSP